MLQCRAVWQKLTPFSRASSALARSSVKRRGTLFQRWKLPLKQQMNRQMASGVEPHGSGAIYLVLVGLTSLGAGVYVLVTGEKT